MKKYALVLVLLLVLTGCTVVRIDTQRVDNIVDVVLSKKNKLYNHVGKGYKYYIPRDVNYIDTNEYNDKLYSEGVYYYLYVDVVSYYYKTKVNYPKDQDGYYYRELDDKGYLKIDKEGDKYHINFVYNYARIEAMVMEKDIEKVVLNSSYILSTVKFNKKIIALTIDEDYDNAPEQYGKFQGKETEDYFLDTDTVEEK